MSDAIFFVILRVGAFFLSWPVFDKIKVSLIIKLILIFGFSMMIAPMISETGNLEGSLWVAVREMLIGFCLGFITRFFFIAAHISGQLIQSSFLDLSVKNDDLWSDFQVLLITVIFFCLNGHYAFISALYKSYEILPISQSWIQINQFSWSVFLQEVFWIGVSLSIPFLICIFLVRLLGLFVQRWSMNLQFVATHPALYLLVFLFVFLMVLPFWSDAVNSMIQISVNKIFYWMRLV